MSTSIDRRLYDRILRLQFFKILFGTILGECTFKIQGIRVCTINDYVSADEFDFDNEDALANTSASFTRADRKLMVDLIKLLAPIRLYLVGNEEQISNGYSRFLIASERNVQENSTEKYFDGCAFIEHELVGASIRRDLPAFLGTKWQINASQIILQSINEFLSDRAFKSAIKQIDDILSKRDMHTPIAMWEKILN